MKNNLAEQTTKHGTSAVVSQAEDTQSGWSRAQWLAWAGLPAVILIGIAIAWMTSGQAMSHSALWPAHQQLFLSLNQTLNTLAAPLWVCLTLLGDTSVALLLVSPLMLARPRAWFSAVLAVPLGGLYSVGLKYLAAVPRPAAVIDHTQFTIIGPALTGHNSFPSGHSITAMAVTAAVLAAVVPRPKRWAHAAWIVVTVLLGLSVCLSRIALGAHWPLDVAAGAAGGWLAGLLGAAIGRRWQHQEKFSLRNPLIRYLLIAMFAFWPMLMFKRAENDFYALALLSLAGVIGWATSIALLLKFRSRDNLG
jgi:membrane-associated phospholipid phosphatase